MRIIVVCGAGASSAFAALHLRRAATDAGLAVEVAAGTVDGELAADLILLGHHLADQEERVRARATPGASVHVLDRPVTAETATSILGAITPRTPTRAADPAAGPIQEERRTRP